MEDRNTRQDTSPSQEPPRRKEPVWFPSSEVGVTLEYSEETLKKIERLEEEAVEGLDEALKFLMR